MKLAFGTKFKMLHNKTAIKIDVTTIGICINDAYCYAVELKNGRCFSIENNEVVWVL